MLHTITEPLGIFIGFQYFLYIRKKQKDSIADTNRIWILIGATFGALFGSRIIGGFENPKALIHAANPLLYMYENQTIVGGLLGGLAGVEITKKLLKENYKSGDLFTFPIILGMIIGRIGCFSMGVFEETYGTASTLPWAMNLGDGITRHPVALYEILYLVFLWFILYKTENHFTLANGAKFKLFMIAYLLFRFLLDFIKPHYTFNFGLSSIQITCIIGLVYYGRYILKPTLLLAPLQIKPNA